MPLIKYVEKRFPEEKLATIARANTIIKEYDGKGYELTLRQLYYQFVARGYVANNIKEYNRLGDIISDARLAGLVDWYSIVDRTRNVVKTQTWTRPSQIIEGAMSSFTMDKWDKQPHYVEVWVEKDALKGIVGRACGKWDVPYFSCRGYTSMSEVWSAAQRLLRQKDKGKIVHIIHLGDHDPSGIDMTRDIQDRLDMFTYSSIHIERIALNMDQVEEYAPPPNPAKTTDSRYQKYLEEYGEESWELDALEPDVLVERIQEAIEQYRDETIWEEAVSLEERGRATLKYIVQYFPDVVKFLRERRKYDDSPLVCARCFATQNNPKCMCDDEERPTIQLGPGRQS